LEATVYVNDLDVPEIDDEALTAIVSEGHSPAFGARFLKRIIDERVKMPISLRWRDGSHFHVRLQGADVVVEPAPAKGIAAEEMQALSCVA
jgi:ATP-dependent Clp protease ATP-binding subunit ClpA